MADAEMSKVDQSDWLFVALAWQALAKCPLPYQAQIQKITQIVNAVVTAPRTTTATRTLRSSRSMPK
jgi:hypothetical protein